MFKKLLCAILLVALTVPAFAADEVANAPARTEAVAAGTREVAAEAAPPLDKKIAYALLDSIGRMFHQMAATGAGVPATLEKGIQQFMADAKKAKAENQINPVFYRRYAYLLAVIKMVAAPDPGGILSPVIDRELSQFVGNVLGEEWKGSGAGAIGQVANAIAYEIIDLQMYVDNLEAREKLRKVWDEKFLKPEPAKKDAGPAPADR
jgi:hypothetical protein